MFERPLAAVIAVFLIAVVLWDGFETIVLPRRVTKNARLSRLFYRLTWPPFRALVRRVRNNGRREGLLSFYGPLSLLALLVIWALGLVAGFALLQWSLGSQMITPEGRADFFTDVYHSGVTFFTLGFGDVVPVNPIPRFVAVAEAGTGFGFLAVIIGYLPVMYQAFSEREVNVSLLDERAGSPPIAIELLRRHIGSDEPDSLGTFLREWERWSAELLESHLSYPVLGYFRSQHENQSWIAALTMILDACALLIVGVEGQSKRQAQLTFAMARHAAVDLAQIFDTPPVAPVPERLTAADTERLVQLLALEGIGLRGGDAAARELADLRGLYEPYVNALGSHFVTTLPPWLPQAGARDVWQITAWETSEAEKTVARGEH